MLPIPYQVVDVFTASPFGGNPLAVIPDARGLEASLMQRLAREFGFSETTFVFPPADPAHTAQVRIFTPVAELPFAGHPNVGTAFVLARGRAVFGRAVTNAMIFEEAAGLVSVSLSQTGAEVTGAMITAPQPLEIGPEVPVDLVAGCASLLPEELAVARHPPLVLSVGLPFVVAEVASRAALARSHGNREKFEAADRLVRLPHGGLALFLYVPEARPGRYSARMFAPMDNVAEDPATGSAAAALGAYLGAESQQAEGEVQFEIEQGRDMGRPSQLHLAVQKAGGQVTRVAVGGQCVPIMRGELLLSGEPA
jgi:trans-2,3-dihydro-3-hydroxyanthranilate isomerase